MITDFIDKRTANVYGIYGHLGGGKTLTAVELAVYCLSLGWSVTSNVEIKHIDGKPGKFTYIDDFSTQDPWQLPCGAPRGSPDPFRSVIVIDECAEFFDQYSSGLPHVKKFLSWLRHSSKRGQIVLLIVQAPEFISKPLRILINKWICCVDMEQYRLPHLRLRIPFTKPYVWRRLFDKYGNLISRGFNFADKAEIGWYYNTAQSVALEGRGNDYAGKYDRPPKKRRAVIFAAVLYLLTLYYFI